MKIGDSRIGFVGFGHMAQTIFKAMESCKLIPRSQVLFFRRDTHKMRDNEREFGITSTSLENLVGQSDILFLGMRPSQAAAVLQDLARIGVKGKMIITMLAGVRLDTYYKYLGSDISILRVMPNIASAVHEGMTVLTFGSKVSGDFRSLAHLLFSSFGLCQEVTEDLMDISCAIAGSGPGFVLTLINAMALAGQQQGLAYPESLKISAQVFAGAARLILNGSPPEDLILRLATPQGSTEAGLDVMKENEVEKSLQKIVYAAAKRSAQISQETNISNGSRGNGS